MDNRQGFSPTRVVDRVIFDVLRKFFTGVISSFSLACAISRPTIMVPVSTNEWIPGIAKAGRGSLSSGGKVNFHRFAFTGLAQFLWNVRPGLCSSFSIQIPSRLIFALCYGQRSRRRPCRPGRMRRDVQTDNANVVREVFTAKLRAKTSFWASSSSFCSSWTSRNA